MNVSLTPELERFIKEKVATGLYNSSSEVVREALRLLEERDRLYQMRLEELRKDIQLGIDQLERGESFVLDENELDRIKARGREKLAERRAAKVA